MAKFPLPLLSSLRAFEAAARHQSIRVAGEELHISHSAVSKHLQKLERELGRTLFERRHRKIALTDSGRELLEAVTSGFSHIQQALERLGRKQRAERVIISVDPDFAALWLVPRLAEFYAIVPNTLIEIVAEKSALSSSDPRLTCVIQYAEAGLGLDDCELLFRSHLFPVCAGIASGLPRLDSLDDLRHHVLLHDRSTAEWEDYLRGQTTRYDIKVKVGMLFSDTALCMAAAVRGQGVAMGDDFLAAHYLAEGRLVKPFGPAMLSKNAYYLVTAKNTSRHPAGDAFRRWLLASIEHRRHEIDAASGAP